VNVAKLFFQLICCFISLYFDTLPIKSSIECSFIFYAFLRHWVFVQKCY